MVIDRIESKDIYEYHKSIKCLLSDILRFFFLIKEIAQDCTMHFTIGMLGVLSLFLIFYDVHGMIIQ